MQNIFYVLFVVFFLIFSFFSCSGKKVNQLSEFSYNYLRNQESARCECLDKFPEFGQTMEKTIKYLKSLPDIYNMDSLTQSEYYRINLEMIDAFNVIKMLTECVNNKSEKLDNFQFFQIQYEIRQVMDIDSTMSETEILKKTNLPGMELIDEICPHHLKKMELFYEMIQESGKLPEGLR